MRQYPCTSWMRWRLRQAIRTIAGATLVPDLQQGQQPKSIILLSDGTGSSAAKVWRTNVWRLFTSLNLADSTQVAFYDDGVGSASFKPLALLGGIFGWGLKRNVLDLYTFLCRNYKKRENPEEYPKIYAFGFSRGAFTIRVLLGLIESQGLIGHFTGEQLTEEKRKEKQLTKEEFRRHAKSGLSRVSPRAERVSPRAASREVLAAVGGAAALPTRYLHRGSEPIALLPDL